MGRKLKQHAHNASIYFQIFDEDIWLMIDKLMALPKYAKSRTSLLNNALAYGLPKLIEEEFGEIKLCEEPEEQPTEKSVVPIISENITDRRIDEMIRLLQEIVMNSNINKSLLCSLFNEKTEELKRTKLMDTFKNGGFRDTPDYLAKYEIDALNAIDDEGDEDG